jgi:hypothetical protein
MIYLHIYYVLVPYFGYEFFVTHFEVLPPFQIIRRIVLSTFKIQGLHVNLLTFYLVIQMGGVIKIAHDGYAPSVNLFLEENAVFQLLWQLISLNGPMK